MRSERGAVIIETATTIPVFLLLFGAGIELLRFAFYAVTLQLVASSGARFASLGECGAAICSPTSRAAAVESYLVGAAAGFGVSLAPASVCIRSEDNFDCSAGLNAVPTGRRLLIIQIRRPVTLFFGLVTPPVQVSAVSRLEPTR